MTKEEFEALMDKYLSGQASAPEERLIEDFFSAQKRKQALEHYTLSEAMWSSVEDHIHENDLNIKNTLQHKKKISRRRIWIPVSVVLTLAITFGIAYYQGLFFSQTTPRWITSDSPKGQKSIITLKDGSRVFLNAGSSITYPEVFFPGSREVKLSGEAFFEITKNPRRPFIVTTGNVTTKVLGTSFNIQAFPAKQISITVAMGSVQVEATRPQEQQDDKQHADRVILNPNDQAVFSSEKEGLTISKVNIGKYLAWKDNTLFFEDTSIEDVAAVLGRWYNVTIEFDNALIKPCRINGQYKGKSLENILKSIQYMYHVEFKFSGHNTVTLYGKGCNP